MYGAENIEAGYTWVNSAQIIYDELPFGGVKQSGLGKEHGDEAIEHYTDSKSVVIATESARRLSAANSRRRIEIEVRSSICYSPSMNMKSTA